MRLRQSLPHKAAMNPHREEGIRIAQKYAKHLPPSEEKKATETSEICK
jgi:hypothetical protein